MVQVAAANGTGGERPTDLVTNGRPLEEVAACGADRRLGKLVKAMRVPMVMP